MNVWFPIEENLASTGYTFCYKLLEELEDKKFVKMYGLVTEFIDIIRK